jgi:hypothetical protein
MAWCITNTSPPTLKLAIRVGSDVFLKGMTDDIVPNHRCGAMDLSAVMADLRWDALVKWHSGDFFY